jgi:RNA polymerase sigma-70 factor (ECF subfamily)
MRDGPEKGLRLIEDLLERKEPTDYYLAHSAPGRVVPQAGTAGGGPVLRMRKRWPWPGRRPERRFLAGRLAELKIKIGSAVDFPSA